MTGICLYLLAVQMKGQLNSKCLQKLINVSQQMHPPNNIKNKCKHELMC